MAKKVKKKLTKDLPDSIFARSNFSKLEKLKLVEVDKSIEEILDKIPYRGDLPTLQFFKPFKIHRKYYQMIMASLLHCSTQELVDLVNNKQTPSLVVMLIKLIKNAIETGDIHQAQFILSNAEGKDIKDHDLDMTQRAVIIIGDPEKYDEKKAIEQQKSIQELTIKDYEELASE